MKLDIMDPNSKWYKFFDFGSEFVPIVVHNLDLGSDILYFATTNMINTHVRNGLLAFIILPIIILLVFSFLIVLS